MKAMIFAAGLGSRLKPYTLHHPKALVSVGGKPMLQRVIENIASAGVTEFVVNVHHFADQIIEFLNQNNNFGLDIKVSDESNCLLDTGGGLLKAKELLISGNPNDEILLHNADILTDAPLSEFFNYHRQLDSDITLLCSRRKSSRTLYFNTANSRLVGWENLSTGETKPVGIVRDGNIDSSPFGGVHIINTSVLQRLEEWNGGSLTPFSIIPFYLENLNVLNIRRFLLPSQYFWFDVGSTDKLAVAEEYISCGC